MIDSVQIIPTFPLQIHACTYLWVDWLNINVLIGIMFFLQCHTFSWQSLDCSMKGPVNMLHSLQFESSYRSSWCVQEWQSASLWRDDFSYVDNSWRWSQALLCIQSMGFRFQTLLIWQICNEWKLSKLFSSITRSGKQIQQKHQSFKQCCWRNCKVAVLHLLVLLCDIPIWLE